VHQIDAIEPQKYNHRGERRPFVAVDERVIARNAKTIGGGKDGEIGFAVGEFIDRSRKCGFEKPDVTDPVGAAEKSELLGVKIKNDADVEPCRLIHFANAL
jgi:hypothetical protein